LTTLSSTSLAAAACAGGLLACAAILGLPDPSFDTAGDAEEVAADGTPADGSIPEAALEANAPSAPDGWGAPPSCEGENGAGISTCGPDGGESCCATELVVGGTYNRSNDPSSPATASSFRLDRFEVTVARFRRFFNAVLAGWTPDAGSGKHTHLNRGYGLANVADAGGYEQGWDGVWTLEAGSASSWDVLLESCLPANTGTWTMSHIGNEDLPIVCETWYEAYAFCIWDGAFLPSEAEWNFAAAGGSEQLQYPWGDAAPDCLHANSLGCVGSANRVGRVSPTGDGRWLQADLAGNVREWTMDSYAPYVTPCSDCAYLGPNGSRAVRDFSYRTVPTSLRSDWGLGGRIGDIGFRCARSP
jgi:formylglycine-generating enzyme required for sulfatase activity